MSNKVHINSWNIELKLFVSSGEYDIWIYDASVVLKYKIITYLSTKNIVFYITPKTLYVQAYIKCINHTYGLHQSYGKL